MKVKDPHFILEKVRKYLDEDIVPSRYRDTVDIEQWKYFETSMDEKIHAYMVDYDSSAWADFRLCDTWGGYDRVAWFKTTLKVPESFRGSRLAIKLLVGPRDGGESTAETLLYIDGHPVQGHRYADISEGNYGVSLLNDCKYGWDIHENIIGLSLIKSSIHPDETADRKIHKFTYSLYPHSGTAQSCEVLKEAVKLNVPFLWANLKGVEGGIGFEHYSMVWTDSDHVLVDTVKRAEEGRAFVVRMYEYRNIFDSSVTLEFAHPVKKAVETNLCEEEEQELVVQGQTLKLPIECFEIKTVKIYY